MVERCFNRLKQWRGIAIRSGKTAKSTKQLFRIVYGQMLGQPISGRLTHDGRECAGGSARVGRMSGDDL